MAPDDVISKTYKTNVNNYITGGHVYIMVWAKNSHDATISTDYIRINYAAGLPVGGIWVPIDKSYLPTPWLGLVSLLPVTTASIVYLRHRKKQRNSTRMKKE
jgi:tryptophan-rich sensory protein